MTVQSLTWFRTTNTTLDDSSSIPSARFRLLFVCWCWNELTDAVLVRREAKIEFGEHVASRLKLSADGTKVLWPQPSDDPEDPQNVRGVPFSPISRPPQPDSFIITFQWSDFRKGVQLFIITLAAIVPDFQNGVGTRSVVQYSQAKQGF